MCRRTTCKQCGKPSWAGCGAHVEQVLGDVPKSDRCRCNETKSAARPPATSAKAASSKAAVSKAAAESADRSTFGRFKAWLHQ